MATKYHAVGDDEKFDDIELPKQSSESLGSTLLADEEDSSRLGSRKKFDAKWMWLGHVVLLSLSIALFAGAHYTRLSTLRHVQQFSAYCKILNIPFTISLTHQYNSSCSESRRVPNDQIQ